MDILERKRPGNSGPLRTSLNMQQMMHQKIKDAVEFASKASIYNAEITATELTTAQSILLSLMYSLLNNDLGFFVTLLELANSIEHLKSSYLPLWLKDDFNFKDHQVLVVLSRMTLLLQSGFLVIPAHILKVFANLAPKYRVIECCSAAGQTDVLKFLKEFGFSANLSQHNQSSSYCPPAILNSTSPAMSLLFRTAAISKKDFCDGASAVTTSIQRNLVKSIDVKHALATNNDDEASALINTVENIEISNAETQEVWVEAAESLATSTQSNDEVSSTASHISSIREYLKVPEDFEEQDLLSLINYSDAEGITPLHNAVKEGDPYIVEIMLELGAKVDAVDAFGYTPTHCAASIGSVRILQVLAQHRANLSLGRHDGCTPLHEAIINGHIDSVKWLLDHGSEISVRNTEGWTPLHLAAQWDQLEIVKLLLQKGASLSVYNNNGQTAIDVARQEGNVSVVQLLSSKTHH